MARIPLQAQVLAFAFVEEGFPEGGLPKHIVMHDGKMIRPLGAVLKGNAHSALRGQPRHRLPKAEQLRQEILERSVNRISAALEEFRFDDRAGKTGDCSNTDMRRDLDGPLENGPRKISLTG